MNIFCARKSGVATLLLGLLFYANITYAVTGSQLYEFCTSKSDNSKIFCDGVIFGNAEGLQVMNRISFQRYPKMFNEKLYCIPKEAPPRDIVDTVVKFLNDHPEERYQATAFITLMALSRAFPCK